MRITRCDRCLVDIPDDEVPSAVDQHGGYDLCRKCLSAFDRWMTPCMACGRAIEMHLGLQCGADLDDGAQCDCDDVRTWL